MGKSNAFVVLFFVTSEVVLALVLHDWQVFISICCSSCWRHLPLFFNQTSPFSLVFCSGLFKGYPPPMPRFSHQVFNVFGIGPQQGLNIGYPKSYQHFPKIRIKWGQGIPGIPHSQTHKTSHCFTLFHIVSHCWLWLSMQKHHYPSMMGYPLVNIQKTMERSTMLLMGKLTISMAIFHSYFDITRGYILHFSGVRMVSLLGPRLRWVPTRPRLRSSKRPLDFEWGLDSG